MISTICQYIAEKVKPKVWVLEKWPEINLIIIIKINIPPIMSEMGLF